MGVLEFFGFMGLLIMAFGLIIGVTAFIGWVNNDDDGILKWIISSVVAAVSVTALIMQWIM